MEHPVYYLQAGYNKHPKLLTFLYGEVINLKGKDIVEKIPATKKSPAREVKVRGATQADFAALMSKDVKGNYSTIIGVRNATPAELKEAAKTASK